MGQRLRSCKPERADRSLLLNFTFLPAESQSNRSKQFCLLCLLLLRVFLLLSLKWRIHLFSSIHFGFRSRRVAFPLASPFLLLSAMIEAMRLASRFIDHIDWFDVSSNTTYMTLIPRTAKCFRTYECASDASGDTISLPQDVHDLRQLASIARSAVKMVADWRALISFRSFGKFRC